MIDEDDLDHSEFRYIAIELVLSVLEDMEKNTSEYVKIYKNKTYAEDDLEQIKKRITKIKKRLIRVLKLQRNENFIKFMYK
jgi:hypothetical protein